MSKPGNLRETMPTVAGWVDDMRTAFGAEAINGAIRAGLQGQPTFWASENGVEIGTRDERRGITLNRIRLASDDRAQDEAMKKGGSNGRR